jgi:hypothetical protein
VIRHSRLSEAALSGTPPKVELEGRLTVTVPEAGRLLGVGRDAAYAAAARGEIPVLTLGRRLVVPVALLYELLGIPPDMSVARAATAQTSADFVSRTRGISDEHTPAPTG